MRLQQDPGGEGGGLGGQGPGGIPQVGVSGGGTPQPYQPGRVSTNGNSAPMAAPQMSPSVREQGRNAGFNPGAIGRFFSNPSPDMNAVYSVPPGTADAWRTNGAPASWGGTPSDLVDASRYQETLANSRDPFGAAEYSYMAPGYELAKLGAATFPGATDWINKGFGLISNRPADLAINGRTSPAQLSRIGAALQANYDAGQPQATKPDAQITIGGDGGTLGELHDQVDQNLQDSINRPTEPDMGAQDVFDPFAGTFSHSTNRDVSSLYDLGGAGGQGPLNTQTNYPLDTPPSVGNPQTQAANQNPTGFGTPSWDPSQQRPSDSYTNGGMNRFGTPNGQEMAQRGFSNWQAQNQNNPFGNYSFNPY